MLIISLKGGGLVFGTSSECRRVVVGWMSKPKILLLCTGGVSDAWLKQTTVNRPAGWMGDWMGSSVVFRRFSHCCSLIHLLQKKSKKNPLRLSQTWVTAAITRQIFLFAPEGDAALSITNLARIECSFHCAPRSTAMWKKMFLCECDVIR